MSRLQAPKLLTDLYRDLRDRRLLIPAAALLVALLAVPLLLGGGEEPVAPAASPAPLALSSKDAAEVQSAVFVEDAGIRNYRKRLEALKSKNPFKQQYLPPVETSADELADATAAVPTDTSGSTAADPAAIKPSTTPSTGTGTTPPSTPPTDTPPVDTPPTDPEEDPLDLPDDELLFYTGTADVTFGPIGDTKRHRNIKFMEVLPSESDGVIAFLGLSTDAARGYFLLSPTVVETDGDGKCSPKRVCQILELSIGDERTIKAADADSGEVTTYRLKLLDTDIVEIQDPQQKAIAPLVAQ